MGRGDSPGICRWGTGWNLQDNFHRWSGLDLDTGEYGRYVHSFASDPGRWVASGPSWSGAWRCELDLHSTGRGSNVGPISGRGGKRNSRGQSDFAAVSGGCDGWVVNQQGVAGALVPLTPVGGGPIGPGGGGGAALAGPQPGAAGLGIVPPGDAGQNQVDLRQLESAVQQLQAMALSPSNSQRSKKKKKKKTKSDKKDKRHKKSKKKKKGSGSSSSSDSSSNRSRSRSSSSSSSNGKKKPLRWKADGTDKKVTYSDLSHVDGLKFKKRGDLVAFAARHPGALTAHFLASVYQRLSKGQLTRSSQLRDVSVTAWAHQFSGLTEVRDVKEVLTLAEILDAVNRKEISQALDVLCQRILAIQSAKQKGGSWERAEAIELVDNRRTLASSSMLALTNN